MTSLITGVIHTMTTMEFYSVRGKVRLKLLATVDGSVLVTKESPTMVLVLIFDNVKHMRLHILEFFFDVFCNGELRLFIGRKLEVIPCSDLHYFRVLRHL